MTVWSRLRAAALALLVGVVGTFWSLPAPAAQAASCTGVWVVVGSDVRCAGSYSTGLVALRSAGFDVQTVGSGFVCRIGGFPDTCTMSSPYWTYFHATRSADGTWGAWTYSNLGAGSFHPSPNVAEGWAYGSGGTTPGTKPPTATPSSAPTASTTQAPAPPSSTATKSSTTTRPASSSSSTSSSTSGVPSTRATSSQAAATASGTSAPTPSAAPGAPSPATPGIPDAGSAAPATSTASTTPAATAEAAAPTPPPGGLSAPGTPVATAATAGVVVLGGAGLGAWALRRRRR